MFHRFLVFFKASRKFAFGFPDITLVTIFAWDRVDGATSLIFRYNGIKLAKSSEIKQIGVSKNYSWSRKILQKGMTLDSQSLTLGCHCQ